MHRLTIGSYLAFLILISCVVPSTLGLGSAFHQIELFRQQGSTSVTSWPVTFGVPFQQGELSASTPLGVVSDAGQVIPSQVERVSTWDDGSVRWLRVSFVQPFDAAHKYYLRQLQAPQPALSDDIVISRNGSAITLSSKSVRFDFGQDAFPERIYLDKNADGVFDPQEVLSEQPQGAFYAKFLDGRRGTMRQVTTSIETPAASATGPVRYAVIKVEGNYLDDQTGAPLASGAVYYHFYAGDSRFRLDHKFVFTRHGSGINELGIRIPVNVSTSAAVVEDTQGQILYADPNSGPVSMVQVEYPHFNETRSQCRILEQTTLKQTGDKCGSWADLYGYDGPDQAAKWGLAVQLPGFAEQFPKAFEIGQRYIQVELWSTKEGAHPLNFTTQDLFRDYFGQWMNNAPAGWINLKSANGGVGKTHEIWMYPHVGEVSQLNPSAVMGATTEPPMTYADLDHVAESGAFGPLERRIAGKYDATENAIADYFDRMIFVSRRVFPPNGFLLYGMHPYVGQGWDENPWRPNVSAGLHESRLSWSFDYDLRRTLFPLWVRTGDRRFYDYARPHARFSHDMQFSNAAAGIKPKGWVVLGAEDPPMLWGSFGPNANLNTKPKRLDGNASVLASAGADDLAQLVQAYFLTADFHARDMVENWKAAVATEIIDPIKPLDAAEIATSDRPDAFIRMLGAAYGLNREPWLANLGESVLAVLRPANPTFDNFINNVNYAKAADTFTAYYHYYLATGSPIARSILLDRAAFGLRFGFRDRSFTRHDVDLLLSGALAASGGDRLQGNHLRWVLETYGRRKLRLAEDLHMNVADFNQSSTADWQHAVMTTQVGRSFGLPAIMNGIRKAPSYYPSRIPITMIEPTDPVAITFEHTAGSPTMFEFTMNLDGADLPAVGVMNVATLQPQNVVVQPAYMKRLTLAETADSGSPWYLQTGSVACVTIIVPISAPSGQYRLTLGEHIRWRLLDYSASRLVLEAPRGFPLVGFEDYYFRAAGTGSLPIYAYRPI